MWRPNKRQWAKGKSKWFNEHFRDSDVRSAAYEAGADAMLEVLFKLAKESPTGKFEIDSHVVNVYRIPDVTLNDMEVK